MRISPIVRRKAKDHGIDLDRITGTGPSGRVTQADLELKEQNTLQEPLTKKPTAE